MECHPAESKDRFLELPLAIYERNKANQKSVHTIAAIHFILSNTEYCSAGCVKMVCILFPVACIKAMPLDDQYPHETLLDDIAAHLRNAFYALGKYDGYFL